MLDASVLLAAEDPSDPNHDASSELLRCGEPLATLDLAAYETSNVAITRWLNPQSASALRERCFAIASDGAMVAATQGLLEIAAGVALENDISVYDAAYVAGARSLGATLASCDRKDLVDRDLAILPRDALEQDA